MAKKRVSKWNIHVRNVGRLAKSRGIPHKFVMAIAAKSYNKSTGKVSANWKATVKHGSAGKSARKGSSKGHRKGRKGSRNLDSFSGLDRFLSSLLGGVKRAIAPRLRPSETLAQRKASLENLIDRMGQGIAALKDREKIDDMNRAQYKAHLDEIKKLVAAQAALKKAWREAHKKSRGGNSRTSYGFPPGWNEHKGGFDPARGDGSEGSRYDGDPSRRKKSKKRKAPKRRAAKRLSKSGSPRKRTSGKRRVTQATRHRMSLAAKRRWREKRAGKRAGKSTKHRSTKGTRKRKSPKKRRDFDFGSF